MTEAEDIIALLQRNRLHAMAERLTLQEAGQDKRSFLERFGEVVRAHEDARVERSYSRRAHEARLPLPADLGSVLYSVERNLRRQDLDPFRNGEWVRRGEHLVITGKSGRGTTFLACALAEAALRNGYRVRYEELPTLIAEWHAAREQRSDDVFVRDIERNDLLVVDDWGNTDETLDVEDIRGLRRCLRPMFENRSVLIASKNPPETLSEWLGGRETADELVDWLSKTSHRLELLGPSLRTRKSTRSAARAASRSSR
jgi:DNA replication protein DnaC